MTDELRDRADWTGRQDDPAAIRAEIRKTRERMGQTVEQLGDRLNPGRLKAQVKHDIREATIGKVEHMAQSASDRVDGARRTAVETIRENPIPAAMIGIGLGWLIYSRRQSAGSRGATSARLGSEQIRKRGYVGPRDDPGYELGYDTRIDMNRDRSLDTSYGTSYDTGYEPEYPSADTLRTAGGEESGVIDRAREKASDVADQARETAGEVADRTREVAGQVADRAQDAAGAVAFQARNQARRLESQLYDNPLAVGAAALALGVAVGLSIPETRREDELLGNARDKLVDRVREAADETKRKVEHVTERVATQARSTAKEAAREEGLTT